MPAWSKTFRHIAPDGSVVTGIACGRSPRRSCSVPGCTANATFQCDFPVYAPSRKSKSCDRWLCREHAKSVGPNRDYCPPHVRADQALRRQTPLLEPPLQCAECGQPFTDGEEPFRRFVAVAGSSSYLPGVYHRRCGLKST